MRPALIACLLGLSVAPETSALDRALTRLYNFDFAGAHRLLDTEIDAQPGNPLPYAFRASALLFQELDRLKILESDFFGSDKRISDKKIKMTPDPAIRQRFYSSLHEAENRAKATPTAAIVAVCITAKKLHPYKKAIKGLYASFKYTYWPPAFGYIPLSSP